MASRVTNDIEDVRAANDIVRVVSGYLTLKKSGRTLSGLCPFHHEKTPSFYVYPDTQRFSCYGCGLYGDVFAFIMRAENLSFPEAVNILAEREGMEYRTAGYNSNAPSRDHRETLHVANELALQYYQEMLPQHQIAQELIQQRGLRQETVAKFCIGYAPEGYRGLMNRLEQRNVTKESALEAGLLIESDKGDLYDRFHNRLMFPIWDAQGRVVGFGGRAMEADAKPKYLNTSETPVFRKSRIIYALHLAKTRIQSEKTVLLLEGYMDVAAAHQAGFTNAIATMGTAITPEHVGILKRFSQHVTVVYDGDTPGQNASSKAAAELLSQGMQASIVCLPDNHDPDSYVKQYGAEAFANQLKAAVQVIEFELNRIATQHDMSRPEERVQGLHKMIEVLASIPDSLQREQYIMQVLRYHPAGFTDPSGAVAQLRREIALSQRQRHDQAKRRDLYHPEPEQFEEHQRPAPIVEPLQRSGILAEAVLLKGICNIEWCRHTIDALGDLSLATEGAQMFFELAKRQISQGEDANPVQILAQMTNERDRELVSRRLGENEPVNKGSIDGAVDWLQNQMVEQRKRQLQELLQRGSEGDTDALAEYQQLMQKRHHH